MLMVNFEACDSCLTMLRSLVKVFLLSEHILCKKSFVIEKKFDLEILMYLHVLRSPEVIYANFEVMCLCVSEHDCV